LTQVHLDTDFGGDTDDLCALAYLLGRPDVELLGVTTCCDSGGKRAGYVRYVLDLAGIGEVPVAAGAAGSLGGWVGLGPEGPGLPPEDEFWPEPIPALPSEAGDAVSLLEANAAAGAVIVGIGTYTNLALLEAARPGLLASTRVVLMGGYTAPPLPGYPGWGPEVDWNVQQDMVAARVVWERCRPTIVPLAPTLGTYLRERDLPRLREAGRLPALIARQSLRHADLNGMRELGRAHSALPDDLLNFHYDPSACAVALGWEGAKVESFALAPDTADGWLVPRLGPGQTILPIVTAIDGEAFNAHWLDTVTDGLRQRAPGLKPGATD